MTRNNTTEIFVIHLIVVNCFQKLLSSWHETTLTTNGTQETVLWIAFKNYYLRDTTQLQTNNNDYPNCCELLSKIIIFVTRHNVFSTALSSCFVVNCFQKLLSSWHDTTNLLIKWSSCSLWIAFKNYYLRDTTQRSFLRGVLRLCCELLSKIIIFVTRHNHSGRYPEFPHVVNCFQKLLSSWHDTT